MGDPLRLLSILIDGIVGALLGLVLAPTPLGHFFSARAVGLLRIGAPDTWFQGPVAMVIGIFGEFVFVLPFALAFALLPEASAGRALGKHLCAMRLVGATSGALVRRFLIKTSPLWLSVLALITGVWVLEQIALAVAGVLILGWLVPALTGAPSVHDRLAGTMLERSSR